MVDDVRRGLGGPLFVEAQVSGAEERGFSLPTGTITFLLSDVEGSTRRWEDAPDAMTLAVPRHYELLDEAITNNGGVRPVEQGEGDSVVGAFSRASDAVAAALAAQRSFASEPWPDGADLRVRIALHTGEAQVRSEGSYLGHALNRCARIRATAHGGQVLLSAATAALVTERLPAGATLIDLGMHRLKDLGTPEHIWQLAHPDVRHGFPPLRSLEVFRHNLPVQLTPLIGRVGEIADLCSLLRGDRLVTLTGSAGVGKTRLALAVAAETLERYPGGVWWVELAPLAGHDAVGRASLAVLGAREAPGASASQQLAVELGEQPALLVLDNCEHLIEGCAALVAELLAANPSASVLTTSREPLGVPGEITWRVPSMSCPEHGVDLRTLSQYDAVVLFVERARRARPSFAVNDANAPAVAQICHRLDGIPLAIELAAARCRQMSPERIASELDDRFRLLTGGARTVMARQQTLTASVDWSHERLDDAERITFRRLGVFAGPFPLEAAEAVVAGPGDVEVAEVFDMVSRLVDKSLVVAFDGPRGETRYRLLETLRIFALDRARAAGDLTAGRDAHAAWWAHWLEPRGALPTDEVLEEIEGFHGNLKAALDWSVADPPLGLRLLRDVSRAWDGSGRAGDAMVAADSLLSDENAQHFEEAWLEAAARSAPLHFDALGPTEYRSLLDRIARTAERVGETSHHGWARAESSMVVRWEGPEHAIATRDLARERGDKYLETWLTIVIAFDLAMNEPGRAESAVAEASTLAAGTGSRQLRDGAAMNEASLACSTGDLPRAIALAKGILGNPSCADWSEAVRNLSFAALLSMDEDALRIAADASDRGLLLQPGPTIWAGNASHRLRLLRGEASISPDLALSAIVSPSVWTLWLVSREGLDAGAANAFIEHESSRADARPHPQAVVAAIQAAAAGDEDRWHDALGIALEQGLRLIAVDALEGLACAAARAESWNEALRLLGAAARLRGETGYRWRFGFEERAVATARAAAVAALGDGAAAAEDAGRSLDWREAAAYARRARGERKRPHHGWASLTPTDLQVVALVSEGLTNPQIAERLLMGRATVKTHLEHVFTKLGMRTRAELAAEATRRSGPR
jgi:predicted ATPase/class 3 adenylate cyclase/DNA-binding CsgD family transcriptional regulator